MRILGIDASSTAIGYAVVEHSLAWDLIEAESLDLSHMAPDERFAQFRDWVFGEVERLHGLYHPHSVVIERPQTKFATPNMLETVGMVRAAVVGPYNWGVQPMMHPKTARKLIGVGGNATKEQAAEYVRNLLDVTEAQLAEHCADAAAVAIAGYHWIQNASEETMINE